MQPFIIGDTECVRYEPCVRIQVILDQILPQIEAKSGITVHALAKLEARCWKLASKCNLSETELLKIWDNFRNLGKKGYDDRCEIWGILKAKARQTTFQDFEVAYA